MGNRAGPDQLKPVRYRRCCPHGYTEYCCSPVQESRVLLSSPPCQFFCYSLFSVLFVLRRRALGGVRFSSTSRLRTLYRLLRFGRQGPPSCVTMRPPIPRAFAAEMQPPSVQDRPHQSMSRSRTSHRGVFPDIAGAQPFMVAVVVRALAGT